MFLLLFIFLMTFCGPGSHKNIILFVCFRTIYFRAMVRFRGGVERGALLYIFPRITFLYNSHLTIQMN